MLSWDILLGILCKVLNEPLGKGTKTAPMAKGTVGDSTNVIYMKGLAKQC